MRVHRETAPRLRTFRGHCCGEDGACRMKHVTMARLFSCRGRGPFVAAVCSTWAPATEAPTAVPEFVAWIIAGTMALLAVICWLPLLRSKARAVAADAKIAPLQTELDKALRRIRGFSESQERFVGSLAQEIKAPLATVMIHTDLLLASASDPATERRYAKSIAEDLRHLSELVESFLRLARPFALEDTSHHVPVHFHDLVLEAVHRCQSLASTRAVSVVPMLAESRSNATVEVLGDAVLLQAMIENLVRNGVLSAPRGTQVDLHVGIRGDAVVLSVRDHGAKIDDDQLDTVFDGFFQVPVPFRPSAGTGLSLAIAKRVAEHHRGTISLRNVPEGGCEFAVQLPRWDPKAPPGPPTTKPSSPAKPPVVAA